jgi:hypothetical protein
MCSTSLRSRMLDEGPQIKNVLIQRGKAVARIEHTIDELATFRSISAGLGSFWSESNIIVSVVSISVGRDQEVTKYYGVRLHSNSLGEYFRYCECYLDFEETDEFLNGIELVKSSMKKMRAASAESKQVYYSSKDDVHVGFYQARESSKQIAYLSIDGANGEMFRFRNDEQDNGADEEAEEYSDSVDLSLALGSTQDFDQLISTIRQGQELIRQWMQGSG